MTLILGIAGKKRHGKDAVAQALMNFGFLRIAFADHLKWMSMHTWDLSFEQVYGDALKEVADERWGLSPRHLLQTLGTQVGREIHSDTWIRKTFSTISKGARGEPVFLPDLQARTYSEVQYDPSYAQRWSIPDCRFPNEAEAVKAAGGVVVKVIRPSILSADTHASETEVDNIKEDYLIINDGSLQDLQRKVNALMQEIL